MPKLDLSVQTYDRSTYGLAEARLVNMLVEPGDTSESGKVWFQRPGLSTSGGAYSVGTGPIRGILTSPVGVGLGKAYVASGGELYLGTSLRGACPDTVLPGFSTRMACSDTQFVVITDFTAYCDDAGVYGPITDPDMPTNVYDAVVLAGRFIYVAPAGLYYWSAIGDATNIDGLAFASAESDPDALLGALVLNGSVYFIGGETIERHVPTSDPDAPYIRVEGGGYSRGCATINSVVAIDNSFIWVTDTRTVARAGSVADVISTTGIEARLRACTDIGSVTAYRQMPGGHEVYVLNIPGQGSFGYDVRSKKWSEWQSYGRTLYRGRCAAPYFNIFESGLNGAKFWIGDDETGQVWIGDPDQKFDGADTPITRIVPGVLHGKPTQRVTNVALEVVPGVGLSSGQGSDPMVESRYSDDGGNTWSNWEPTAMGAMGEYDVKPVWWGQGMMKRSVRPYEFRCAEPVNFCVTGATHSEQRP